jgi:heme exporter protein C
MSSLTVRRLLLGISFATLLGALYMIFSWVPTEREMGIVQRIFYFHVPIAWCAFLAFFIVFVCSIMYLWKRDLKWDIAARSAAEIGVLFTTLVLITGSIWAKVAWLVWWTWEPRLTSALIMWLIYIAYLLVRSYTAEKERGARFAAVVGIVGFIDVPIVALAIQLWRTQHPLPLIFEGGLAPEMLATLLVSVAAITLFFVVLLMLRTSLRTDEEEISRLRDLIRET